ncbi:MAG: flagellar protein FlhE [Ewingella americana]|jgi:flagellar protein FlhE|uniref:Flagellar protein flhE n=1 Tax=Ewingella americana TaxID=41202 RepID=A0A377NFT3_9GAMM|nr:flagellar protein FlhE [Ewingella americana]KAA8729548.1 flagellar protein FlhE [Ewingella americana]MCI1678725.1 flagellar protein FlhE [Ewingella americana]MCI1854312.1 flagellar protein FlhE [Ewingella americana]MCI1861612.1 flagellar protein FlhE [Ewingella americana]MCI2140958.1 flagellar protein FlhE [Ewingella americana]
MKRMATGLLMMCCSASALAASGSWSDSKAGVTLQNRGQMASAAMLSPAANAPVMQSPSAAIDTISWSYSLLGPEPAGLQVQLCSSSNRCQQLDAAQGQTRNFFGQSAQSSFRLVFGVEGQGRLNPPLRVVSQQVIVNYH